MQLTLRFLLFLEVLDPLFQHTDSVLQAGNGGGEFEVKPEGDADLVVRLGDAARVLREVLLVTTEACLQVLDGLRVVLAL